MRSKRINYVVVGGFVLLVLAGFLATVAVLTGRTGASDSYYTVYDNVAGIQPGTPVRYEGYPIGRVEAIRPGRAEGALRFRVMMSVERGWAIPRDSRAAVVASGLLAGVSIDIRGGESADMLAPGSEIAAGPSADLFAVVSDVAGEVTELSEEGLKPLLAKLNRYVDRIGRRLSDDTAPLLADLQAVTRDLRETTPRVLDNLETASRTLNDEVLGEANRARFAAAIGNLEGASAALEDELLGPANRERLATLLANMETFSTNFARLSERLQAIGERVDGITAQLDGLMSDNREEVDQAVKDLRYTLGAVARHIDAITYNLEGTSRNMHEFSRQIRQNPGLLLGGAAPADEARE